MYATNHTDWRRGKGVAIALRASLAHTLVCAPKIDSDLQLVHARLRGLLPDRNALLHVISCYLPCEDSLQLGGDRVTRHAALEARYAMLQHILEEIMTSAPGDMVVVAGDLNAKIGSTQALGPAALAALLAAGLPTQRSQLLTETNYPGELLNDLCTTIDLVNLTGIAPGDSPAQPTFSPSFKAPPAPSPLPPEPPQRASRIDHFLVSPSTIHHLHSFATCPHVRGSDHIPLRLTLSLARAPAPAAAPAADGAFQYKTIAPPSHPSITAKYMDLLTDDETWASFWALDADPSTTLDQISTAFSDMMFGAAVDAGHRVRTLTSDPAARRALLPPKTNSNYKCWHDNECKRLQQAIRAIPPDTTDPRAAAQRAELRRLYRRRVTRLVRQHKLAHAVEQLRLWRHNSSEFWRHYRPASSRCPITPAAVAAHFKTKMNSFPPASPGTAPASPPERQLDATSTAPTPQAIAATIRGMISTAAGIDGLPTCLFKPWLPPAPPAGDNQPDPLPARATAANALARIAAGLHAVFKRISSESAVPTSWHTAVLVPIYKCKGDQADISNYRPLSVPTVACRVWSSLTNKVLMDLTADVLPDTMFGFRPGLSCTDPLFILRHLLDTRKHMPAKQKVFAVAFMDLSGAYDSIDRELLFWKLEHQLGVAAHTLATLRDLYRSTTCTVKVDGSCSMPFEVGCGLRQGCPLSTTLFNLFIWDLHQRLCSACPDVGVPIRPPTRGRRGRPPRKVTDVSYADDISLCASTPEGLQKLSDCFCTYCAEHGLIVNPAKCEVMVFGSSKAWPGQRHWTLLRADGRRSTMAVVTKFKYLGVELHGDKDITAAVAHRHSRMVAAQAAVNRRLKELRIPYDPMVVTGLFAATTAATGSYGCEVWATRFLGKWSLLADQCKLQSYQAAVYKHSLGVPRSTANLLTFFEVGRYPMQIQWLARTLRYWNKLTKLSERGRSLLADAFVANVDVGVGYGHTKNWAAELRDALQFVYPDASWTAHLLQRKPIEVEPIVAAAQKAFCNLLHTYSDAPDADDCTKRHFCKYATHMMLGGAGAEHDQLPRPAYVDALAPLAHKQALARLRLSSAPIQTNMQRSAPYSQRWCTRGCIHALDSEQHLLFECQAVEEVRVVFWEELDLANHNLSSLMDRVYQPEQIDTIMDFNYRIIGAISGPAA